MPDIPRRILLGRIAGAHGIRGDVLIRSFAGDPQDIAAYGPLTDADGKRSFTIKAARVTNKGVVARIAGVADRNGAEALVGVELYVDRDRLPEPEPDTFYHSDLVGLAAVAPDGSPIGRIAAVVNYGAGDILEIAVGDSGATELVPFSPAYVPDVDIAGGRVTVVLPESIEAGEPSDGSEAGDH